MKKLLLILTTFLFVNAAYAQCDEEVGTPIAPSVADPYCFEAASDLVIDGYSVDPADGFIPGFIVAQLDEGQTAGEGTVVGVTFDGSWDFSANNPVTGELYINGGYAFIPSVYSESDLQALITNPIVTAVIPFNGDEQLDEVINAIITNETVLSLIGIEVVTTDAFYSTLLPTLVSLVGLDVCVNSDTERAYTINVTCLSTISVENLSHDAITLYPNPADNFVNVNFESTSTFGASIDVYDLTGKMVSTQVVNVVAGSNSFEINTTDYTSGVYLLQINDGVNAVTQRLTVNR